MPVPPKTPALTQPESTTHADLPTTRSAGAELVFDEADALFGKRTDVRDAHDRYSADSTTGTPLHKP